MRALLIKTKNLGDSVILTSVIRALSSRSEIDVLVFSDSREIFDNLVQVNQVFGVTRGLRGFKSMSESFRLFRELRSQRYDVILHFSDDWRGAVIARLLKPRISAACRSSRRGRFWNDSFTHLAPPVLGFRHAAERDLDIVRRADLYQGDAPPFLKLNTESSDQNIRNWLGSISLAEKAFVAIHANSRWKFKEIPKEIMAKFIDDLWFREGKPAILTGSAADIPHNQLLASLCKGRVFVAPAISLTETASVIAMAEVLVSIDSVAVHLASAMSTPVVAIYGPSGEKNWGPWRVPYKIVSQDHVYPCRPCGIDGCGGSKNSQCLNTLSPESILHAYRSLLSIKEC